MRLRRSQPPAADALVISHLPNLRYLSGLEATAGQGLLTAAGQLYLLVDPRYEAAARDARRRGGRRRPARRFRRPTSGPSVWIAAHCAREGVAHLVLESRVMPLHDARLLQRALAAERWAGTIVDTPLDLVEGLRRVKDTAELALLREGGARLSEAARGVLADGVARPGRTELEVAADIDARVRAAGFSRAAFDTIVASGPRSALPHARPTARRLEAGEVVVLDFGGVYGGYCVDLTRTVCLGQPSTEVDRQYQAVLAAQQAGCAAVRPGASPADVDRAAGRCSRPRVSGRHSDTARDTGSASRYTRRHGSLAPGRKTPPSPPSRLAWPAPSNRGHT